MSNGNLINDVSRVYAECEPKEQQNFKTMWRLWSITSKSELSEYNGNNSLRYAIIIINKQLWIINS